MINILKPAAESGTALSQDKFFLATLKLTVFYVLSTAVILFVSSMAILIIFAPAEIELPFSEEVETTEVEHDEWSNYELREHLAGVIILVDVLVLFFVSIFSYYFARRTLSPIKTMHETQTRFLGDVAHELRTPLSIMKAGADTLLRKQRMISEYEEFITDVQEETGRLTRLSNQLLQLLKSEGVSKVEIKEVNVSDLTEVELRRFTPYAEGRRVTISGNISPNIRLQTEQDSLIEIVQNILKNAIDYNKHDGRVTVTVSENDAEVTLEITDTGIGITPEAQTVIFDRFVKADRARTQTTVSGAGLGLSIVKSLVTKIGGQLSLKSSLNVGTTVTITLPKTHS